MAIDISSNPLYVHSNIYHLIDSEKGMLQKQEGQGVQYIGEAFNALRTKFTQAINQLKTYEDEIYRFMGVSNCDELNNKLFGHIDDQDYRTALREALLDPGFIYSVTPKINKQVISNVRKRFNISKENAEIWDRNVKSLVDDGMIQSIPELRKALQNFLIESLKKDRNGMVDKNSLKTIIKGKLIEGINRTKNRKIKIIAKDTNALINQQLKEILSKLNIKSFLTQDEFLKLLEPIYREHLERRNINRNDNSIETDMVNIYNRITYNGDNILSTYISNLLGQIGESLAEVIVQDAANGLKCNVAVLQVGDKSEEELAKSLQQTIATISGKQLSEDETKRLKMDSIHQEGKMSQTDVIYVLHNDKNEIKIMRIQSKNNLINGLKNYKEKLTNPMITDRMFGRGSKESVKVMLERLSNGALITGDEMKYLQYYLVNYVWFYNKGSYERGDGEGGGITTKRNTGSGDNQGLWGAANLIDIFLSSGLGALLGLTLKKSAEKANNSNDGYDFIVNPDASNTFFLLSSRTLFPVSAILQNTLDLLEGKDISSKIHMVVDKKTASYVYDKPKAFYEAKTRAVGGKLDASKNYENTNLLGVGSSQGQAIFDSITGHINLQFNIEKILRSSYLKELNS